MGITDAFNPGVISEKEGALAHAQAASPLFVLMPMRLSGE
jgi:DNA polymerase-3 subunit beta